MLSDKEIVDLLVSNEDPDFEAFFFNRRCELLLSKIRWKVYDNQVPLEELASEFMLLLKKDGYRKLQSFKYESSLFYWLRTVANRHFISVKNDLMPKESFPTDQEKVELDLEYGSREEVKNLLDKVLIPKYKSILRMKYLEKKNDGEIRDELSISEELYREIVAKAEKHLIRVIRNEGDIYVNMFLKVTGRKFEPPTKLNEDPTEKIISKIDLENLTNSIPNERIRFVIRSLILDDMDANEVAKQLGITVSNLYVLKNRAIKQLALMVGKEKKSW